MDNVFGYHRVRTPLPSGDGIWGTHATIESPGFDFIGTPVSTVLVSAGGRYRTPGGYYQTAAFQTGYVAYDNSATTYLDDNNCMAPGTPTNRWVELYKKNNPYFPNGVYDCFVEGGVGTTVRNDLFAVRNRGTDPTPDHNGDDWTAYISGTPVRDYDDSFRAANSAPILDFSIRAAGELSRFTSTGCAKGGFGFTAAGKTGEQWARLRNPNGSADWYTVQTDKPRTRNDGGH